MLKIEVKAVVPYKKAYFKCYIKGVEQKGDWSGVYYQAAEVDDFIDRVKAVCEKFINKVDTSRARSVETYADCKQLLEMVK